MQERRLGRSDLELTGSMVEALAGAGDLQLADGIVAELDALTA